MKSKLISLASISAGFIAIFLTLGAYVELFDLLGIILASCFVILPLYYNSFKASVLTYLVGGVIALIFSGFNFISLVFPAYFAFFGIYPILKFKWMQKGKNRVLGVILGLIWCTITVLGLYYYYTLVMTRIIEDLPSFILSYIEVFVILFAIIIYFIFDRFILAVRLVSDRYLKKIIK